MFASSRYIFRENADNHSTSNQTTPDESRNEVSQEIVDLIDDIWRRTDDSLPNYLEKYKKYNDSYSASQKWRTVRIFISSTFTDFFVEREVVVKKVCI